MTLFRSVVGKCALGLTIASILGICISANAASALPGKPTAGPFLDGQLPTTAPSISSSYEAVVAFTNLLFMNPMGLTSIPGSTRLAVWEREGKVWAFENDPAVTEKTLLLDLSVQCQGWGNSGLFSLAFHPGYVTNGWTFVYYTWVQPGTVVGDLNTEPPEQSPGNYRDRVSRFTLLTAEPPALDTEVILIDQITDSAFHSGGSLFFHPSDGFLYWCNGDDHRGATQVIDQNLLSGVFRIDVDQRGGAISHPIPRQPNRGVTANYFIPNDNPFVGDPNALEEFYALGLRNPYRMSVDPQTRRIFIGDVGNNSREEINVIEAADPGGLNFQWPKVEGAGGVLNPPYVGVSKGPLLDYMRIEGRCVIGGFVYRGAEFADELEGRYIFGDNSTRAIWALDESTLPPSKILLATFPLGPGPAPHYQYQGLSSFGLDDRGELYMCQLSSTAGRIYKLARRSPPPPGDPFPALLSETGVFSDTPNLLPSSNLIPYEVNSPLWSDGADKKRWFTIPKNTTIGFSPSGEWSFPAGSLFVKHFEMTPDPLNPAASPYRLETRLLLRAAEGGVFGATYKWRADNSDAELVENPLDKTIAIETAAGLREQVWHYPSPSECLQCHTPASRGVLGPNTRQLNREYQYPSGITVNQLRAYDEIGLFYPALSSTDPESLPRLAHVTNTTASLELRARSYLDSNCSHCHRPGAARTYWDARFETPLELSGVLNGPVSQSFDIAGAKTIVPGHPQQSIILHRAGSLAFSVAMPPLAKNVLDMNAIALLAEYIGSLPDTTNSLPAGWSHADIGPVAAPASISYSSDALNVIADAGEIYGTQDAFSYIYQELDGDGEISARVASISGYTWARTGLMIRSSLDDGAPHAYACLGNREGVCFFYRTEQDGSTTGPRLLGNTAPLYVRIARKGNLFTGYRSSDGVNWLEIESATIEMPSKVYIGFASTGRAEIGSFIIDRIHTVNVPPLNVPPRVTLHAKANENAAVAGPLLLSAAPEDVDGYILMVEFFQGSLRLGQATTPPFELLVHNTSGFHEFSVRAYDNLGALTSSSVIPMEIQPLEISLANPSGAGAELQVHHLGNDSIRYLTESSLNLIDWFPVATNTPMDGSVSITLPTTETAGFYRVRTQ